MQVVVNGFKSIDRIKIDIGDLTIFIGPPSSGKSNLLESLMMIGYIIKTSLEPEIGERSTATTVGRLNTYARGLSCNDFLNRLRGNRKAAVSIENIQASIDCSDDPNIVLLSLSIQREKITSVKTRLYSEYNAIEREIKLLTKDKELDKLLSFMYGFLTSLHTEKDIETKLEQEALKRIMQEKGRIRIYAPRLYGFDRLRAIDNIISGRTGAPYPISYLDERAINISRLLYVNDNILKEINDIIEELSGIRVEPLSDGRLAFFDHEKEIGASSISDTVLRLLYGLTALLATKPINKRIQTLDIELNITPIVMIEEPEAHMYPVAFNYLAEKIHESINKGNKVIITTHSGKLAQVLWEYNIRNRHNVYVYYIYRDAQSYTRMYRVNVEQLAERLEDLDSIISQHLDYIEQLVEDGILV